MINLILCGGSGTRLWPISRKKYPKQFCYFFDNRSLFQKTLIRNKNFTEKSLIVTNEEHFFIAHDQINELKEDEGTFILETYAKNTAPAIILSALFLNKDDIILVSPSDHIITDLEEYEKAITEAEKEAEKGFLVVFGIKPTRAYTGYGYIEIEDFNVSMNNEQLTMNNEKQGAGSREQGIGDAMKNEQLIINNGKSNTSNEKLNSPTLTPNPSSLIPVFDVKSFKEKPNRETAEEYVEKGTYFWNSGMLVCKVGVLLDEIKKIDPKFMSQARKIYEKTLENNHFLEENVYRLDKDSMKDIESISIDHALLERSKKIKAITGDFGWDDLGSFDALYSHLEKDEFGNTVSENYIQLQSKNNLVISEKKKTITTLDINDLLIIDTPDALMVTKRGSSEKIRKIVEILEKQKNDLSDIHLNVHRPWGNYRVLQDGYRYKIKNVTVKPGKSLSLQKHYHRSEHWIVVNGNAEVHLEDKIIVVSPNESIYIPVGKRHRLKNPGKIDLVLIEVSVGDYLNEDDIIRYDDEYGRS